jgi:hypothetical protein
MNATSEVGRGSVASRTLHVTLLVIVTGAAALHLTMVFLSAVNFDEFRYLSVVYNYQRGTLNVALQSIHVHLFGWLPDVGTNEIDQVTAARLVYYLLLLGSCGFVYLIGKRFFSGTAALFVVLCYLSYAEVILHATAFRFDGLSVFLLLATLAIILQKQTPQASLVVAGLLTAVALLVTIKSVFYLPTLMVAIILRRASYGWTVRAGELVIYLATLSLAFTGFFMLHEHSLGAANIEDAAGLVQRSGERGIRLDMLFPARQYLLWTILLNMILWLFALLGAGVLIRRLWYRDRVAETLLLLALLLPLGSLVFYRNAFPYFYAFLMPAALMVCGVRFDEVRERLIRGCAPGAEFFLGLMIIGAVVNLGVNYARFARQDEPSAQRQVVEAVHRMFPDPVPYIDGYSMIASFPKVGLFMSAWGIENYRDAGVPIFAQLLREAGPIFLIVNDPRLSPDHVVGSEVTDNDNGLFEEDVRVLRDHFIPHWGPIYVAGKRITTGGNQSSQFDILVPGPYTVEAQGRVVVNGVERDSGAIIVLSRGRHSVEAGPYQQDVTLRWGSDLYRPRETPPTLPGSWATARRQ